MKASSKEDLHSIVVEIENLSKEKAAIFLSEIYNLRLMIFHPDSIDRSLIPEYMIEHVINNPNPLFYEILFTMLKDHAQDDMDNLLMDTCNHILFGNDTEDEDSVGGFSQREIDLVTGLLENLK